MHFVLGRNCERTIVGGKENTVSKEGKRISPATTQLLFAFATQGEAGSWSVRKLAGTSGLSKSNVAKVEMQLVERGVLGPKLRAAKQVTWPVSQFTMSLVGFSMCSRIRSGRLFSRSHAESHWVCGANAFEDCCRHG